MADESGAANGAGALERIFGPASTSGFGSAVFRQPAGDGVALDAAAQAVYRHFVGELWERWGEAAWLGPWREVHRRAGPAEVSIIDALGSLEDAEAARAAPLLLELPADAEGARKAIAAVFDADTVSEVRVFNIGDGGAMSGLLVAGRGADADVFLVALMD